MTHFKIWIIYYLVQVSCFLLETLQTRFTSFTKDGSQVLRWLYEVQFQEKLVHILVVGWLSLHERETAVEFVLFVLEELDWPESRGVQAAA